ncbi:MAG: HIT domain-containing protein [Ignavibacteriae bacterium]|nr:HIT domain-containing protein [Ignavibacteria bacterium]MBI3364867.1 HIT domain-containing protein [Ignavibacteriota bacterium]
MERLFSPWRSKYIETFSKPNDESGECILCSAHHDTRDDERFIVTRGTLCFVLMNLYPYNSGHLMIVPYRHIAALTDLTDDESQEIMSLLKRMTRALQEVSHPDGFNVGCNVGRTAGAGIEHHIHFHIVPRWNGDTNFMPILADTKMISEDMKEILHKLRAVLS